MAGYKTKLMFIAKKKQKEEMNNFGTGIWDLILSVLVVFHVSMEFIHYIYEYFSSRKQKKDLEDIINYRKKSTKTEKIIQLQNDINLIKEKLNI